MARFVPFLLAAAVAVTLFNFNEAYDISTPDNINVLINDVAALEATITNNAPNTNYIVKAGLVANIFEGMKKYANIKAKSIEFKGAIGQSVTLYPIRKKLEVVDRAYQTKHASFAYYPTDYVQYKLAVHEVDENDAKIIKTWIKKTTDVPMIFLSIRVEPAKDSTIKTTLYGLGRAVYYAYGF